MGRRDVFALFALIVAIGGCAGANVTGRALGRTTQSGSITYGQVGVPFTPPADFVPPSMALPPLAP